MSNPSSNTGSGHPDAGDTDAGVLTLARLLRRRGDRAEALRLLEVTLAQPALQAPATATLAAEVAWLHLEWADLSQDAGDLTTADHHGLRAVYHFQRAADRGGQAAAALLLGDLAWQGGNPEAAAGWWSRCHTMADSVGNPVLGARALAALALLELSMARPERAEIMLTAAEQRAHSELAEAAAETRVVEASVALVRARQAIRAGRWPAARLLLDAAAAIAARDDAPGLYVDALRLDAVVARRQGDPRSAAEALALAATAARDAGMARVAALVDTERVLALADNESWAEAFELQNQAPSAIIADQPAVRAARLEAFAVLSLRAGNPVAAERSAAEAGALRAAAQDHAGGARATALHAAAHLAGGDIAAALDAADRALIAARSAGRIDIEVAAGITQLSALARVAGGHSTAAAPAAEVDVATRIARAEALCLRADTAGSAPQQIALRDLLAAALVEQGSVEAALVVARAAVALAAAQPLLRWRGRAHSQLAATLLAAARLPGGDALAALRETEVAAKLGVEAEDRVTQARCLLTGGLALVALGRLDEAQLALGHAMQGALALRSPALATEAAFAQGDAFLRLQRPREARHVFEQAVDQARRSGALTAQIRAFRGVAAAAQQLGQVEDALAYLTRAGAITTGVESRLCTIDRARIHCQQQQPDAALRALAELVDVTGNVIDDVVDNATDTWPATAAGELLTVQGQARAMKGDTEAAAAALQRAVLRLRSGSVRSLGAALFLLGQVEGMRGNGDACGDALAEAMLITAKLGLPEQHAVRRVIERIQAQAEADHGL